MLLVIAGGCNFVFGYDRAPPADAPPDEAPPSSHWLDVASGADHSCGIQIDRSLWCWGRNDHGQLGAQATSDDLETDVPRRVGVAADWETVDAEGDSSCATKTDHTLWCWGGNSHRQVGPGKTDKTDATQPVQVPGATWVAVTLGFGHACALDLAGVVSCWGWAMAGALGDGTPGDFERPDPMPVSGAHTFSSLSSADFDTCAVDTGGRAWCWGAEAFGVLGNGTSQPSAIPSAVDTVELFESVSVGFQFACGVTKGHEILCWGRDQLGQLGDGQPADRQPRPVRVAGGFTDWQHVVVGRDHACGVRTGQLWCWGSNEARQLALAASVVVTTTPIQVGAVAGPTEPWKRVGLGNRRTCASDADDRLWCVGHAGTGALGTGVLGSARQPMAISGSWDSITLGTAVTCGRSGEGLQCWGSNATGRIGDGTRRDHDLPVRLLGAWAARALESTSCAIAKDNDVWCWGDNDAGQVGNNTMTDQATPFQISNTRDVVSVSSSNHTCAVYGAGALWCWGSNLHREVGLSAAANALLPQDISSQPGFAGLSFHALAAGGAFTCGIDSLNVVYCWGRNSSGELGRGTIGADTATPAAAVGLTAITQVSAGELHACARASDALYCWGENDAGQAGNGSRLDVLTPTRIAGTWSDVSASGAHTCAIKTDGSLWCWGANGSGQLGHGGFEQSLSPKQVGTDLDWASVRTGTSHTCALKQAAGGALWCWGSNQFGERGDGAAFQGTFAPVN